MIGIIEDWLFNQIGLNFQLENLNEENIFRDGHVFSKIMQKYGLIDESISKHITKTNDEEKMLQNMKLLKPIINMLKINFNEEIMDEIVKSKITTTIKLLYELYLCLENKKHLYFITNQDFQSSRNIECSDHEFSVVNQRSEVPQHRHVGSGEQPLVANKDILEWYKQKYTKIQNHLLNQTEMIKSMDCNEIERKRISIARCRCSSTYNSQVIEQLPDLDAFPKGNSDNLLSYAQFIKQFKAKQRKSSIKKSVEKQIQHDLLQSTWDRVLEDKKVIYNSVFSEIMLKQSQYEKQILTKLIQNEEQVKIQNQNQHELLSKVQKEEEHKINADAELKSAFESLQQDYETEQRKVLELHKKLFKEKQELVKKSHLALCTDVLDSLIDVAINVSLYQSKYGEPIPNVLWNNWKVSFCKSKPVHIPFEYSESELLLEGKESYEQLIELEKEIDKAISEHEVYEYLFPCGRWFYKDTCLEFNEINEQVLAFIVLRCLALKYPPPQPALPADIPPFILSGVLMGLPGVKCVEILKLLLERSKIHIFDCESAIKKSIATFEKETNIAKEGKSKKGKNKKDKQKPEKKVKAGKTKDKGLETKSKKNDKKKKLKDQTDLVENETVIKLFDKETQTSVIKVEEEVSLIPRTAFGLIGEEASKILKSGQSIDDEFLVKLLIEYLKTLDEYEGWLILNYPNNLRQALIFELALTGKKLPIGEYVFDQNELPEENLTDENVKYRQSQLLQLSQDLILPSPFKTHFSIFCNTSQTKSNNDDSNENVDENLRDNETAETKALSRFYEDQNIYNNFFLESCEPQFLKTLARTLLGENNVSAKKSVDLFGEEVLMKLTKVKKKEKKDKKEVKKTGKKGKQKTEPNKNHTEIALTKLEEEEKGADQLPAEAANDNRVSVLEEVDLSPGDEIWKYVTLPLHSELGEIFATIWENIESSYIQNLIDIFFETRVIRLRYVPYKTYLKSKLNDIVNEPDTRQNLVNVFIDYYNNHVEDKMKPLPDVKSKLHCTILELQQILWEIMDERKNKVEKLRQEIIKENWLLTEITALINSYLSLVQNECDRSLNTYSLINDYYFAMLDKSPLMSNNAFSILVEKLTSLQLLNIKNNSFSESTIPHESISDILTDNFVIKSLVECFEEGGDNSSYLISNFVNQEIDQVQHKVIRVYDSFISFHKTEEDIFVTSCKKIQREKALSQKTDKTVKSKIDKSVKKNADKKSVRTSIKSVNKNVDDAENEEELGKVNSVKELMFKEWKFALNTEINRFRYRIDLIKNRLNDDILELYCFVVDAFCDMYKENLKVYDDNINNTNVLCSYFNTIVEEEFPKIPPIVFNKVEFFVECGKTSKDVEDVKELSESTDDCHFTVSQLKKLRKIFAIAGPYGVIRKQPLCYILQDLMIFNAEDNQPQLPKMWNLLNESQLIAVIDEMFGPEFAIDWRDFIIYNLEMPYPDLEDILFLRKQFLSFDVNGDEIVSFDVYKDVTLWFEKDLPSSPEQGLRIAMIKALLFDLFKINDDEINYTALLLYFCKDIQPTFGLQKALSLSIGKNVIISENELRELLQCEAEIKQCVTDLIDNIIHSIIINREGVLIYEITNSDSDWINVNSEMRDSQSYTVTEVESIASENLEEVGQDFDFQGSLGSKQSLNQISFGSLASRIDNFDRPWISKLPIVTVSSVFNASFIHQDKTFTLRNQYLNCLEEEADSEGMISGHELVALSCIQNLFTMTNKFKISSPCEILEQCLNVEQ